MSLFLSWICEQIYTQAGGALMPDGSTTVSEVVVTVHPYILTEFNIFPNDVNLSPAPVIPLDGPVQAPNPYTEEQLKELKRVAACHALGLLQIGAARGTLTPNNREYLSALIQQDNGTVTLTQWYTGGSDRVSDPQLVAEVNYCTAARVIGLIHNHPADTSIDVNVDRYPSGGSGTDPAVGNDWNVARTIVAAGQGAQYDSFTHYIFGPDGNLRAFDFTSAAFYEGLSFQQRQAGYALPPPVQC